MEGDMHPKVGILLGEICCTLENGTDVKRES